MENDDLEIKVCKVCDAPLPYKPLQMSYFNKNSKICDDCFLLNNDSKKRK